MPFKSHFPDQKVPESSLYDYLSQKFEKNRDRIAIIDEGTGKSLTYAEFGILTNRVKSGLFSHGLRKGDTILIASPNCAEWAILIFAALPLGGIICGINPNYTEDEFKFHLEDSGAKFLIMDKICCDRMKNAMKKLKISLKGIFVIDHENERKDLKNFSDLLNFPETEIKIPEIEIRSKTDVAFLPYSSGTTGIPKGVQITHYNLVHGLSISMGSMSRMQAGENVFIVVPFFHIYGFVLLVWTLREGATAITIPKFQPKKFLESIQNYKVRFMALVPPLLLFLVKEPMVSEYDLSSWKVALVSAAPVGKKLSEEFLKKFPHVNFMRQGYGMTELSSATHVMPFGKNKPGSVGMLLSNLECKILNVETGLEVGPNVDGEICIRGEVIMKGYKNRPEATSGILDEDGFLHTGDIGHVDEEGFFFITDRIKELIKVKAFQVAPAELESVILSHPAVRDVGVIGIPDEEHGELPRAFVVLHENQSLTAAELDEFVAGHVAPFKRLKGGIEFVNEIPKLESGKILRRLLKQKYAETQKKASKL